jgi:LETM1 and EF-hand domain-containing protein 1
LRDDLSSWLDLRLKHGVPSTLLVLANAFVYAQGKEAEMTSQIDALEAVLSSIPEELYHEIELEVHTAEGAATNKQRLEVLKEQQELIEEESLQSKSVNNSASSSPNDNEDIDEDDKPKRNVDESKEAKEAKEAESTEKEASTGDLTGGSAERTEQDDRARKGEDSSAKAEKSETKKE